MDEVVQVAILLASGSFAIAMASAAGFLWELRVRHRRRNRAVIRTARRIMETREPAPDGSRPWPLEDEGPPAEGMWRPNHDPVVSFVDRWHLSDEPDTSAPFDMTGEEEDGSTP